MLNIFNNKEERKEYLIISKNEEDGKKIKVIIPKYNIDKIRIITENDYDEDTAKWGESVKTQIMLKSAEPFIVKASDTLKYASEKEIVSLLEKCYN